MLIAGLLDTYEVCFDETLLQFAEKLQRIQDRLFWDKDHSGYYTTAPGNESEIVLRLKEGQHFLLILPSFRRLKSFYIRYQWLKLWSNLEIKCCSKVQMFLGLVSALELLE